MNSTPPISILYTEEQVQAAVRAVAQEVLQRYGEETPVTVLCLLNGAIWFTADLLRMLPPNFELATVRVSSYEGTESRGEIHWHQLLPDCAGKHVLVVDDVLDTGLTLRTVCEEISRQGAASVAAAVAVEKAGCRKVDFTADFCALPCENLFLVGYGLDFDGKYRNLPYIGYIK